MSRDRDTKREEDSLNEVVAGLEARFDQILNRDDLSVDRRMYLEMQKSFVRPVTIWMSTMMLAIHEERIDRDAFFRMGLLFASNFLASVIQNCADMVVTELTPEFEIAVRDDFVSLLRGALSFQTQTLIENRDGELRSVVEYEGEIVERGKLN